ncbi:sensor histidine kinase [Methylibium sp.]|uniref:sensor histidine kinase n=1 Tax=Methylibium sp. TaxID=2067992 RepID=UPI003BAAB184
MKTLYLRIYLTVVAALLLFALVSGWLLQRNIEHERIRVEASGNERLIAWGELLQNALPAVDAPREEQSQALLEWSSRLRMPLALDDEQGQRIATSQAFARWIDGAGGPDAPGPPDELRRPPPDGADTAPPERPRGARRPRPDDRLPDLVERRPPQRVVLSDGRTLWVVRPSMLRPGGRGPDGRLLVPEPPFFMRGVGLLLTLGVLFVAVAGGAYPVVRRLTRRLETLKRGVETFGAGELHHRVDATGRDEIAALATSFNAAATRIESLVQANQSLLANASHELRSPLARLKMALAMLDTTPADRRGPLKDEIERNIRELDTLVEEVLLASRLDARHPRSRDGVDERVRDPVDVIALAAEEAARVDAVLELPDEADRAAAVPATLLGDERLLRRALRNLLENARRYGGVGAPELQLRRVGERLELSVSDRGPGVPESQRERIFEPFYRLPGHAEQAGGVGLGLSLVRQIAQHHGGEVRCEPRPGGGSRFVLSLPITP